MSKVLLCYEDYSEMATTQTVLKKVGFDVLSLSTEFGLSEQMLGFRPDIVIGCGRGSKVTTIGVGRRLKEMPRWQGKVILIFPPGVRPDPLDLMRVRMDMALEAPIDITRLLQILASLTNQDVNMLLERMVRSVAEDAGPQMRTGAAGEKGNDSFFVSGASDAQAPNQFGGSSTQGPNGPMIAKGTAAQERGQMVTSGGGPSGGPDAHIAQGSASGGPSSNVTQGLSAGAEKQYVGTSGGAGDTSEAEQRPVARPGEPLKKGSKAKPSKYEKFLQNPIDTTQSSLNRKAVKKAQKDLKADWSEEALKNQDELRREFTDALFKKKND